MACDRAFNTWRKREREREIVRKREKESEREIWRETERVEGYLKKE